MEKGLQRLLLSKWFYYVLIALGLTFLMYVILPNWILIGIVSPDLALDIHSEAWGLMFTLAFFVILFDLRENVEWRSVKDRVKKRIGKQIHAIFVELSNLCEVERVLFGESIHDEKAWKKLKEKQLNTLVSGKVQLNASVKELWENREISSSLATFIDSRRALLTDIEGRYFKFLDSELQSSLMDIEDYLHSLSIELRIIRAKEENFYKAISDLIGKTAKEIAKIREMKIDMGF